MANRHATTLLEAEIFLVAEVSWWVCTVLSILALLPVFADAPHLDVRVNVCLVVSRIVLTCGVLTLQQRVGVGRDRCRLSSTLLAKVSVEWDLT